ncbi:hypothetical protein CASFOL_010367 [Castilleja foliolosa]|uniref:Uncharacterized protein n=1 Tax=Castilleja foliolosa TaxID=1961234 RepID=A0ABD3DU92_9LAMI
MSNLLTKMVEIETDCKVVEQTLINQGPKYANTAADRLACMVRSLARGTNQSLRQYGDYTTAEKGALKIDRENPVNKNCGYFVRPGVEEDKKYRTDKFHVIGETSKKSSARIKLEKKRAYEVSIKLKSLGF